MVGSLNVFRVFIVCLTYLFPSVLRCCQLSDGLGYTICKKPVTPKVLFQNK